jgi:hypothetical protein
MDAPAPTNSEINSGGVEPPGHKAKRRKIRRGTRSCWGCKRRKVRCSFASSVDEKCIACQRRGAVCTTQDLPDDTLISEESHEPSSDRIERVEALLHQLVNHVGHPPTSSTPGPLKKSDNGIAGRSPGPEVDTERNGRGGRKSPPPTLRVRPRSANGLVSTDPTARYQRELEDISRTLLTSFPPQSDLEVIRAASEEIRIFPHQIHTRSYNDIELNGLVVVHDLTEIPAPSTHPILITRSMLLLALYLQQIYPSYTGVLSDHPRTIIQRLVDTAVHNVTTNEKFHGSMESLECIILEGILQANFANIRRAWLAFRRALSVAQMMGIHRRIVPPIASIDHRTKIDPKYIWFRIVYLDHYLSLLLGFPHGTADKSIISESALANETLVSKFERHLAVIAGRIIERNENQLWLDDYAVTQSIDADLLKATQYLPVKFWLPPKFEGLVKGSEEAFWDTIRIVDQMMYYSLLNALHLPYLLAFNPGNKYEYSKITSVSASREILSRYIAFHNFNNSATSCRLADFYAITAALALLLSHMNSHRVKSKEDYLLHQRLGDLGMIQQASDTMEQMSAEENDVVSDRGARLLRRVLQVEAEAAQGLNFSTENVENLNCPGTKECPNLLHITIPYYGTIRITREDPNPTKDATGKHLTINDSIRQQVPTKANREAVTSVPAHIISPPLARVDACHLQANSIIDGLANRQIPAQDLHPLDFRDTTPPKASFPEGADLFDQTEESDLYPYLAAGVDDWALQGVDSAFFHSLLKGSGGTGDGDREVIDSLSGWPLNDLCGL